MKFAFILVFFMSKHAWNTVLKEFSASDRFLFDKTSFISNRINFGHLNRYICNKCVMCIGPTDACDSFLEVGSASESEITGIEKTIGASVRNNCFFNNSTGFTLKNCIFCLVHADTVMAETKFSD